jgi:hypothetical protein
MNLIESPSVLIVLHTIFKIDFYNLFSYKNGEVAENNSDNIDDKKIEIKGTIGNGQCIN